MDATSTAVATSRADQSSSQKSAAFLLRRAGGVQPPGAHVERAREVELLILAGRHDAALMAAEHPVASDLRVEVDVDLVAVEHRLVGARARFEPANRGQNTLSPRHAATGRARWASACRASRRCARACGPSCRQRPRRSPRASSAGRAARASRSGAASRSPAAASEQQLERREAEPLVNLALAVAATPVVEPVDALGDEPLGRTYDRRARDIETPPRPAASCGPSAEPRNRRGSASPCTGRRSATEPDQLPPHQAAHSRYLHRARPPWAWVVGTSQTARAPRVFPSGPTRDRQSRSVI